MLCASADMAVAPRDGGALVESGPGARRPTFERIYDEHFGDVERWIRALGGRSADIPDLTQDVFTVAFRRLCEFDGQNVTGWLYQIARRKVRDHRRLAWVKHFFSERTAGTFDPPSLRADPLNQLENKETQVLLDRILNKLPAEQRAAFVLFELDGLTGAQIAQVQQVPINTVWARIYRARRRLQSLAGPERPKR